MTLGEKLKNARMRMGLSTDALGEKVGISGRNIRWYESDKIEPKFVTVCWLAQALNVSLNYLAGWEDAPRKEGRPSAFALSGELRRRRKANER